MFPEQVDPGGTKNGPAGARWPSLIWRPQIWPPYGLVRRLDIRLLTNAVAAISPDDSAEAIRGQAEILAISPVGSLST
jgi:hypothetical protein